MASITRRLTKSGEPRYDVRWRVNGRAKLLTFRRRHDADAWRRKVENGELAGLLVDPKAADVAFGTYAQGWLQGRLVRGEPLSPSTVVSYQGLLRRHLGPSFAKVPLRQLTPEAIRRWYSELTSRAGRDQAAKSYRLLHAILATAVDDERLIRNPCRIRGAGAIVSRERPFVDLTTVLDLAETIEPRYRALVLLAGLGGLRTGELLGLRRMDLDLLRGVVHVRLQAQQLAGEGRVIGRPKTDAGRRTVAIPGIVVEALQTHLGTYAELGSTGVVFTGPQGTPLRRGTLSLAWQRAVAHAGAPEGLHVHDLRHHAATAMARMPGVTTKELMARIGHASPRAALIYQHATEERDRAIAAYLDAEVAASTSGRRAPVIPLEERR